jgi:hypothetical protein
VSYSDALYDLSVSDSHIAIAPVKRKLQALQADTKADPTLLLAAEETAANMESIVTKCSISAYKTRALKRVIS